MYNNYSQYNFYKRRNKYNNRQVSVDNKVFDSKLEKDRYNQLKLLEKANEIKHLKTQVKYILQPGFKKNDKIFRAITYIADFTYIDNRTGKMIIEDTKGMKTDVYKIKKKLFEYKYPELEIREITRKDI